MTGVCGGRDSALVEVTMQRGLCSFSSNVEENGRDV